MELVVLTPVLFLLALMILVFGRVSEARQQVVEAARAGAEAAAVLPDAQSAESEGIRAGHPRSLRSVTHVFRRRSLRRREPLCARGIGNR